MSVEEVEQLRRSHAMAPLSPSQTTELLDTCGQLLADRRRIIEILDALPATVADLRRTLNELHRLASPSL